MKKPRTIYSYDWSETSRSPSHIYQAFSRKIDAINEMRESEADLREILGKPTLVTWREVLPGKKSKLGKKRGKR